MGLRFIRQGWVHEVAFPWRGSSSSKKGYANFIVMLLTGPSSPCNHSTGWTGKSGLIFWIWIILLRLSCLLRSRHGSLMNWTWLEFKAMLYISKNLITKSLLDSIYELKETLNLLLIDNFSPFFPDFSLYYPFERSALLFKLTYLLVSNMCKFCCNIHY